MTIKTKICPVCGKEFTTNDGRRIYCSNTCSYQKIKERNRNYFKDYFRKRYQADEEFRNRVKKAKKEYYERLKAGLSDA